jgi:hypothetical protein
MNKLKLMTLALAFSFLVTTAVVSFADDTPTKDGSKNKTTSKKKSSKKKEPPATSGKPADPPPKKSN